MSDKELTVDYGINSEFAGHKTVKGVTVVEAAKDIFPRIKEQAMELAVDGVFTIFETIEELQQILETAAVGKYTIHCYDEIIGG